MASVPPQLAVLAARRHGIVTAAELARHDVSPRRVRRLVEVGHLVRVHNGVYRLCSNPHSLEARAVAACGAVAGLAISGRTAGRWWRLRGLGPRRHSDPLDALVLGHRHVRLDGVRIRRTSSLPASDLVRRSDGILLTSPVRTALELAAELDDDHLESIIEQLLNDRVCTPDTVRRTANAWFAQGRPGTARLRRVLGEGSPRPGGPVGSDYELLVLRGMRARGIDLVAQCPVVLPNGRHIRIDAAAPDLRWGVEVNHHHWHSAREASHADDGRVRQLQLLDWQIAPVSDDDLRDDPDSTLDVLARLYATRRREFRREVSGGS